MSNVNLNSYISNLPIGADTVDMGIEEDVQGSAEIQNLPDGIVTGSNLVEYAGNIDPVLRSSVALSLLAAQRVATRDVVVLDPNQWIERHNTVLRNLNWIVEGGGSVEKEFDKVDLEVHEAIIPFLTVALGGAVAASSLIITALKQLKSMDSSAPWITLFERESRRFSVSEFQFTRVATAADRIQLNMAAARFDASFGRTQILFFKISKQHAKFNMANAAMSAEAELLRMSNNALQMKLSVLTNAYIKELDLGEL